MKSVVSIMKTPIPTYSCPSRRNPRVYDIGAQYNRGSRAMTDYAGNAGADSSGSIGWGMMGNGIDAPITRRPNGTKDRGSSVSLNYITDGTSNTLLAGEKCLDMGLIDTYQTDDDSGWVDAWDWDNVRWGYVQPHADYSSGNTAYYSNTDLHTAFGSSHNNFFNAALCDGSVRTISFNVSLDTFKMLSSRNDGKTIDGNAF